MGRTRRFGWSAMAGLAAVTVASCGVHLDTSTRTAGTVTSQRAPGGGQVVPASFATRAVDATTAERTAHISMSFSMAGGAGDTDVGPIGGTVDGDFDLGAGSMRLVSTVNMPALPADATAVLGSGPLTTEVIVVGGKTYTKVPGMQGVPGFDAHKPWLAMSLGGGVGAAGLVGAQDPTKALQQLKSLAGDLTVVGHESIGGVDTTHYRGTIDHSLAPGDSSAATKGERGRADLWIDAAGLVRQVRMSGDGPVDGAMTMTMTISRLGEPVHIVAPPADQVQTFDSKHAAERFGAIGGALDSAGPADSSANG